MENNTWTTLSVSEDDVSSHRIGPVTLFIKKVINDIWVAFERDDSVNEGPAPLSDNPDWKRVALPETCDEVELTPVFPDKPVVIDTEYPYRIVSRAVSRVFSRIPASIRITPVKQPELIISEIPIIELSLTWFGPTTEGELCYALSSTARRILSEDLLLSHLIVCPIHIHNKSDEELQFEKVTVRVEKLSIYQTNKSLWANETYISYLGKDAHSEVEVKDTPPDEVPDAILVSKPKNPIKKSLAIRSFKLLRDFNISGL